MMRLVRPELQTVNAVGVVAACAGAHRRITELCYLPRAEHRADELVQLLEFRLRTECRRNRACLVANFMDALLADDVALLL
jgi:hypothetical protein